MLDIEGTVSKLFLRNEARHLRPILEIRAFRHDCSTERGSGDAADAEIKRNLADEEGVDPFIGVYTALATVYGRRMHSDRLISPPNLVHYPCLFPSRLARMEGSSRNSKRGGGSWRLNERRHMDHGVLFLKIQTFLPSFFHSPRFPLPSSHRKDRVLFELLFSSFKRELNIDRKSGRIIQGEKMICPGYGVIKNVIGWDSSLSKPITFRLFM